MAFCFVVIVRIIIECYLWQPAAGQDSVRDLCPVQLFRTISTLRVVSHEKDCMRAIPAAANPAPKPTTHCQSSVGEICQTKLFRR